MLLSGAGRRYCQKDAQKNRNNTFFHSILLFAFSADIISVKLVAGDIFPAQEFDGFFQPSRIHIDDPAAFFANKVVVRHAASVVKIRAVSDVDAADKLIVAEFFQIIVNCCESNVGHFFFGKSEKLFCGKVSMFT